MAAHCRHTGGCGNSTNHESGFCHHHREQGAERAEKMAHSDKFRMQSRSISVDDSWRGDTGRSYNRGPGEWTLVDPTDAAHLQMDTPYGHARATGPGTIELSGNDDNTYTFNCSPGESEWVTMSGKDDPYLAKDDLPSVTVTSPNDNQNTYIVYEDGVDGNAYASEAIKYMLKSPVPGGMVDGWTNGTGGIWRKR